MRKRIKKLYLLVVLGILASSVAGCAKRVSCQKQEERYVVGAVTKSSSSEYWMSVHSGMEAAAAEYQMELIFLSPDSELKEDVQEKMITNLIERKIDALAISPIDSYTVPVYMKKLEELGMPVVTFDTGFEGQSFPYIGIDNEQIGYKLAATLAKQIGHKGSVGIVAGSLDQRGHRERVEGFQKYMESEKEITIDFIESGYGNLQMSEKKVRTLLEEYPDVKGIFATSAVTALGLSGEMSNRNIKIVTVDEQKDALEALENGSLAALAPQSGYEIGYETIRLLNDMRTDNHKMKDCIIDVDILTKENVGEYRRRYETQKYSK